MTSGAAAATRGDVLLPHPAEWMFGALSLLLTLLPVLVGLGLLLLYLRSRRPRVPLSTDRALMAAGHDPSRPPAAPAGQWNARVTQPGHLEIAGDGGLVRLENGWLGFHVAGVATPTWIVPASHLRAGKHSLFSQAEVWIDSQATGRLNVTVSHEHINLVVGNDLKNGRERRYADEFLWLLHQAGATIEPG